MAGDAELLAALDKSILQDKAKNFRGTARVWISNLDFPHSRRQPDPAIISQLKRDFEGEGCLRAEHSNHVPAVMDEALLQLELKKIGMNLESFLTNSGEIPLLSLDPGIRLECLHGQHRVLAAVEHFPKSSRWWHVDVYDTGLNHATRERLYEGYTYTAKYTSGEVYRQFRLCCRGSDAPGAERWRSRLSSSQEKFLNMLLKRPVLVTALDSILTIAGLWRAFYLGSLDVFLTLRCDEEIAHYIFVMRRMWFRIFHNKEDLLEQTDPISVRAIQARAPALSASDAEFTQEQCQSGKLFPMIKEARERSLITRGLLKTEEVILSMVTLFKDIRSMKPAATMLRSLLPKPTKNSLRQRYYSLFSQVDPHVKTVEVQQSTGSFATLQTEHSPFEISYQQIWLCSLRLSGKQNPYSQQQLAVLASKLGFSSPQIEQDLRRNPAHDLIRKTVAEVVQVLQPNCTHVFDADEARQLIELLDKYVQSITSRVTTEKKLWVTVPTPGEPLSRRVGSRVVNEQELDKLFLTLVHHHISDDMKGGSELSPFYVLRCRHLAFFDKLDLPGMSYQELREPRHNNVEEMTTPDIYLPPADSISRPVSSEGINYLTAELNNTEVQHPHQVASNGRVINFEENGAVVQSTEFQEEAIRNESRAFADLGKSLTLSHGTGYFLWSDCFSILSRTGAATVYVEADIRPINGKRRRVGDDNYGNPTIGRDLVTLEDFDVPMLEYRSGSESTI